MLTTMFEPIVIKALFQSHDTLEISVLYQRSKDPLFIDFVLENEKKLHKPYSERLHKFSIWVILLELYAISPMISPGMGIKWIVIVKQ